MADEGPSLPSDYVTILHLKERWLKQQHQQSNPNHPQPKDEPKHDSASKTPNESENPRKNRHQINNHPKPDADSASKITNEGRNRHPAVNQLKPDVVPDDSASKTVVQVAGNHSMVEKQDQSTNQSKSKPSTAKNGFRGRNPRFAATNRIPNGGSTPPLELETVKKKKQHLYTGGRPNRSQEVRKPKGETAPFPQAIDDSSHNESDVVQEKKQHRHIDERRNRNRNQEVRELKGETTPFAVDDSSHNEPEVVKEKKQHRRNRNPEVREPKGETPPLAQNMTDDSLHNETESVREKKQHRGRRNSNQNRSRNQEVREPRGETPPFAQKANGDDSSHNDSGELEAAAAAAAVKGIRVTNLSQRSNRRYDSGSFYNGRRNGGVKPPFGAKIGQTTAIWVKKGESSLN